MGKYRLILVFSAANDKAAGAMAAKAQEQLKADEARLTTRRETWGAVAEEPLAESAT